MLKCNYGQQEFTVFLSVFLHKHFAILDRKYNELVMYCKCLCTFSLCRKTLNEKENLDGKQVVLILHAFNIFSCRIILMNQLIFFKEDSVHNRKSTDV